MKKIAFVLLNYLRSFGKSINELIEELKVIADRVDNILQLKIYDIFLENNIITPLIPKHKHLSNIEKVAGIGKRVSFQLPAYYYCIKAIIENRSLDILAKDVLEQAS